VRISAAGRAPTGALLPYAEVKTALDSRVLHSGHYTTSATSPSSSMVATEATASSSCREIRRTP
jgi:hypothetical protein